MAILEEKIQAAIFLSTSPYLNSPLEPVMVRWLPNSQLLLNKKQIQQTVARQGSIPMFLAVIIVHMNFWYCISQLGWLNGNGIEEIFTLSSQLPGGTSWWARLGKLWAQEQKDCHWKKLLTPACSNSVGGKCVAHSIAPTLHFGWKVRDGRAEADLVWPYCSFPRVKDGLGVMLYLPQPWSKQLHPGGQLWRGWGTSGSPLPWPWGAGTQLDADKALLLICFPESYLWDWMAPVSAH